MVKRYDRTMWLRWFAGMAFVVATATVSALQVATVPRMAAVPRSRTINDAHNCYPYDGRWNDRIDRALATGEPVAIEQDLNWFVPADGSMPRVLVGHGGRLTGTEPELERYFFERVRPVVEAALKRGNYSEWPVITLNLDFKAEEPAELHAVRALLEKYRAWLSSAPRMANDSVQPLRMGPVLVLNGPSAAQQRVFYDEVPVGGELLSFGAAETAMQSLTAAPEVIESASATNYRRWWNNPWSVVEPEGQPGTGAWSEASRQRLNALVKHAHRQGLWIRFYTLDGASEAEQKSSGWFRQYNFPSYAAAEQRWRAAIETGVDYLASDQYEDVGRLIHRIRSETAHGSGQ